MTELSEESGMCHLVIHGGELLAGRMLIHVSAGGLRSLMQVRRLAAARAKVDALSQC
jgi:hypothetical protein